MDPLHVRITPPPGTPPVPSWGILAQMTPVPAVNAPELPEPALTLPAARALDPKQARALLADAKLLSASMQHERLQAFARDMAAPLAAPMVFGGTQYPDRLSFVAARQDHILFLQNISKDAGHKTTWLASMATATGLPEGSDTWKRAVEMLTDAHEADITDPLVVPQQLGNKEFSSRLEMIYAQLSGVTHFTGTPAPAPAGARKALDKAAAFTRAEMQELGHDALKPGAQTPLALPASFAGETYPTRQALAADIALKTQLLSDPSALAKHYAAPIGSLKYAQFHAALVLDIAEPPEEPIHFRGKFHDSRLGHAEARQAYIDELQSWSAPLPGQSVPNFDWLKAAMTVQQPNTPEFKQVFDHLHDAYQADIADPLAVSVEYQGARYGSRLDLALAITQGRLRAPVTAVNQPEVPIDADDLRSSEITRRVIDRIADGALPDYSAAVINFEFLGRKFEIRVGVDTGILARDGIGEAVEHLRYTVRMGDFQTANYLKVPPDPWVKGRRLSITTDFHSSPLIGLSSSPKTFRQKLATLQEYAESPGATITQKATYGWWKQFDKIFPDFIKDANFKFTVSGRPEISGDTSPIAGMANLDIDWPIYTGTEKAVKKGKTPYPMSREVYGQERIYEDLQVLGDTYKDKLKAMAPKLYREILTGMGQAGIAAALEFMESVPGLKSGKKAVVRAMFQAALADAIEAGTVSFGISYKVKLSDQMNPETGQKEWHTTGSIDTEKFDKLRDFMIGTLEDASEIEDTSLTATLQDFLITSGEMVGTGAAMYQTGDAWELWADFLGATDNPPEYEAQLP
jgi:hypothetical protein